MQSAQHRQGESFMLNTVDSTATAVTKGAPAVVGTGYSLTHLPLADIAACLTILYTALLIADWCWKKFCAYRAWKKANP